MKSIFFKLCNALFLIGSTTEIVSHSSEVQKMPIVTECEEKFLKIDSLLNAAIDKLHIPGAAIGIVIDDKVVLKGYGVRDQLNPLPVTENTLFAIGSCSKAFTAFALGQLVDKGLIYWDDPVIQHLPDFRLYDLYPTHHVTIRDLIAHRSGLPRHDFVWYNSKMSRTELLNRLRYLEPTNGLREKFQYNNLMYVVAGCLIEKVTGQTWEEYIQDHIFKPLGMDSSNCSIDDSQKSLDFAIPHTEKNGQIQTIGFRKLSNVAPAGAINSSVSNMVKWIQLQLSEGNELISKETLREMQSVHMPFQSEFAKESPYLFGYGLGWMTGLHKGCYTVTHNGGIDGFTSSVVLFPKEKIGVVVLVNSDRHFLFPEAAAYGIADVLMDSEETDWLSQVEEKEKQIRALKEPQKQEPISEPVKIRSFESYVGEFEHPGYGTIHISFDGSELTASFNDLSYLLKHQCYDHFVGLARVIADQELKCSFICNASGEIVKFEMALEPLLSPIVFDKKK